MGERALEAVEAEPSSRPGGPCRILVVDDDAGLARAIERILRLKGLAVDIVCDGSHALDALDTQPYAVMVLDLRMRNLDGFEVLRAMQARADAPRIILHSAYLDVPTTVAAMRYGVEDVIEKSVSSSLLVDRVWALTRRTTRVEDVVEPPTRPGTSRLLGETAAIRAVRQQIRRVSQFAEVPVLIEGETGTGKELIAEAIHGLTAPDEPFVAVNCAAVPADLLESELFGHEAGAFTNAKGARPGLFEEARRGTIFLDEVGEMPASMQPKLLRVLESREFRRVGGNRSRALGARVISATNRRLRLALNDLFRSDLYFRLAGYTIVSPPLRQRIEDVPLLAQEFLARFARRYAFLNAGITPSAIESLRKYSWPGNLRELRLTVENAAMLASPRAVEAEHVEQILEARTESMRVAEELAPHHSGSFPKAGASVPEGMSLPDVERELIVSTFSECSRNMTLTAKRLGIPRSTLRDRLRKLGLR